MSSIFILGQIIFWGYFLYSGINHLQHQKNMAGYAKSKGVPMASLAVTVTGIMLILGGAGVMFNGIIFNMFQQSVILLIVFLVPTTFMMHNFWKDTDPMQKMNSQVSFMKNVALIGALLMMLGI